MSKQQCENCQFWKFITTVKSSEPFGRGLCRKNSPRPIIGPPQDQLEFGQMAYWPETDSDDLCGEWAPTETMAEEIKREAHDITKHAITLAILQEREACAKIAQDYACESIARNIRERPAP